MKLTIQTMFYFLILKFQYISGVNVGAESYSEYLVDIRFFLPQNLVYVQTL
jgi:hypothetical protein